MRGTAIFGIILLLLMTASAPAALADTDHYARAMINDLEEQVAVFERQIGELQTENQRLNENIENLEQLIRRNHDILLELAKQRQGGKRPSD
jgi:cell division protein FtsB